MVEADVPLPELVTFAESVIDPPVSGLLSPTEAPTSRSGLRSGLPTTVTFAVPVIRSPQLPQLTVIAAEPADFAVTVAVAPVLWSRLLVTPVTVATAVSLDSQYTTNPPRLPYSCRCSELPFASVRVAWTLKVSLTANPNRIGRDVRGGR